MFFKGSGKRGGTVESPRSPAGKQAPQAVTPGIPVPEFAPLARCSPDASPSRRLKNQPRRSFPGGNASPPQHRLHAQQCPGKCIVGHHPAARNSRAASAIMVQCGADPATAPPAAVQNPRSQRAAWSPSYTFIGAKSVRSVFRLLAKNCLILPLLFPAKQGRFAGPLFTHSPVPPRRFKISAICSARSPPLPRRR